MLRLSSICTELGTVPVIHQVYMYVFIISEHSDYFEISGTDENNIILSQKSAIPDELIFQEKVLIFNILAEKDLTVGANAAVSIHFSRGNKT